MSRRAYHLLLPPARPDLVLLSSVAIIASVGVIMVASASAAVAARHTGNAMYFFDRQCVYLAFGVLVGYITLQIPMRTWSARPFALLTAGLLMLAVVLLPSVGHTVNGARRWIDVGLFSIQASEPARLLLLLYVAGYAARRRQALFESWTGLLRPMLFIALAAFLLLLEPNFGGVVILAAIAGITLFIAGARLSHLLVLVAAGGALLGVIMVSSPYRLARLISFAHPWAHAQNSGFQLTQSLMAIGHGQILGAGLGNSVQKLLYLPETHTDFLFAVYADEFGLIGSWLLLALFLFVVWRGFRIAQRAIEAGQLFNGFAAYGLSSWLGIQAFVNVAVNMGLLPTKGLTLPLMSYGGSSLVMMCVLCALILRVDMETREPGRGSRR